MMSRKDFLKSHILSWRRKMYSDWEDVTSSGKAFQVFGSVTGKARLPMVDRLTGGTRRLLAPVERSDRLPGTLRTGTSGPRYVGGALPWKLSHYQQCQHYSVQTRTVTTVYSVHRSTVSLDKTYIMQIHKYITADATANTTITTTIAAMTTVHTGPLSQLPRFPLDA